MELLPKQFLGEENIFDSNSDWISIIDLNFKIQYSNKAGELLFELKKRCYQ